MRNQSQDVLKVLTHVKVTVGERDEWTKWPGGWSDDIESALLDAVFSARAIYDSAGGRGVHTQVTRWRGRRTRIVYSLDALVAEIGEDVPGWAHRFGNRQVSPGRLDTAYGGRLKAATVREAASSLLREISMSLIRSTRTVRQPSRECSARYRGLAWRRPTISSCCLGHPASSLIA